ncbi:MAG: methyltransferase [Planctomycetes bacterium]|nr:methyltransferase [Planctomycetota bacterium]
MDLSLRGHTLRMEYPAGVHPHAPTSEVMARLLEVPAGGSLLDLGCGAGLFAVLAARLGAARVLATDLDPGAVAVSAANARANGVGDRVEARVGDGYAPAGAERFDRVVANPPQTPCPEPFRVDKWGGEDGADLVVAAVEGAPAHLAPGGRLYLMHSSLAHPRRVREALMARFAVEVLAVSRRDFAVAEYEGYSPGLWTHLLRLRGEGRSEFFVEGARGHFVVACYRARSPGDGA